MRKKLYFDETLTLDDIQLFIVIIGDRIREYHGYNFVDFMITGKQPEFNIFKMNSQFKLTKLSKYDRIQIKTKANYKLEENELFNYFAKDIYIKLNVIEKFIINYSKKETVFHKMKFKQKLVYFLLFSIPLLLIGYLLKNSEITFKTPDENYETTNSLVDKNENFEDFRIKFYSDSIFQKNRINNPLAGEILEWDEQQDTVVKSTWNNKKIELIKNFEFLKNNMPNLKFSTEIIHDTIIENNYIENSGFYIIRKFYLKEGKWYLIENTISNL